MPHPAIDATELARRIQPWRLDLREETGSTNSDALGAAHRGEAEGLVVLAESQTAGRGRMGRAWLSAPRGGLWLSVLLRPAVEVARWGWIPLLAGVALAETVKGLHNLDAGLKWPNDLLIGGRKCAGILAEAAAGGAVVVGVGLNVWQSQEELPVPPTGIPATSLQLSGVAAPDRTRIAAELIIRLREVYLDWQAGPDRLRERYLGYCRTLGRDVRIVLPGGGQITGEAATVDVDGRLVIRDARGDLCPIAAGDVTHVR